MRRSYFRNGAVESDTLRIATYAPPCADMPADSAFNAHVYALAYTYDLNNRRTELTLPPALGAVCSGPCLAERLSYEPVFGALDSVVDIRGHVQRFAYDLTGRLIERRSPGDIVGLYTYDSDDNLISHSVGVEHAQPYLASQSSFDRRGKVVYTATTSIAGTAEIWIGYTGLGAVNGLEQQGTFAGFGYEEFNVDALGNRRERRQLAGNNPLGDPERKRWLHYDGDKLTRIEAGPPPEPFTYEFFQDFAYDAAGNTTLVHSMTRGEGGGGMETRGEPIESGTQLASAGDLSIVAAALPEKASASATIEHDSHISYYSADNKLRVFNRHIGVAQFSHDSMPGKRGVFEERRYDGLGRLVLTRSRRIGVGCPGTLDCQSVAIRTIWDGERILAQIRAPGGEVVIPPDTTDTLDASIQKLREVRYASLGAMPWSAASATRRLSDTIPDPAIENDFEIVVYTHAPGVSGIDEPVAVHKVGVETVFPHAGWRGMLTIGTGADGRQTDCGVPGSEPCVAIDWPGLDVTVDRGASLRSEPLSWFGTLVSRHAEMSELEYKRNRYYDPKRGQFTQADPIGLAGGLNTYGFADGDPINFSDPFGLCPEPANKDGTVCVALFIQSQSALGLRGDNRDFSSSSDPSQSRVFLHVDVENQTFSATTNPTCTTRGRCAPAGSRNRIDVAFGGDGGFTVSVHARNSVMPGPAIDATFTFRPDGRGGFTTSGNRDAYPSAEAYLWRAGQASPLFQRREKTPFHLLPIFPNDRW